jgi:hypothetical protein
MADVMLNLIDPLEARYNWGDTPQESIIMRKRDMVDAFKVHTIEDLKEATLQVIHTRRYTTMPSVADVKVILDSIVEKRKAAEAPRRAGHGFFGTFDEWKAHGEREALSAQKWAREWLQKSYLGREALDEGWAKPLYGIIWQIKLSRDRAGRACGYEDINLDDIATETARGEVLIKHLKVNCRSADPAFERKLLLQERFA